MEKLLTTGARLLLQQGVGIHTGVRHCSKGKCHWSVYHCKQWVGTKYLQDWLLGDPAKSSMIIFHSVSSFWHKDRPAALALVEYNYLYPTVWKNTDLVSVQMFRIRYVEKTNHFKHHPVMKNSSKVAVRTKKSHQELPNSISARDSMPSFVCVH